MLAMGYTNVQMWYQPVNFVFDTFQDFFETLFGQPTTAMKLKSLSPEKLEELMQDVERQYETEIKNCLEPKHFENMIIVGTKA
jgi:hypothetical protein